MYNQVFVNLPLTSLDEIGIKGPKRYRYNETCIIRNILFTVKKHTVEFARKHLLNLNMLLTSHQPNPTLPLTLTP